MRRFRSQIYVEEGRVVAVGEREEVEEDGGGRGVEVEVELKIFGCRDLKVRAKP